jgi:hypothetical protein
MMKLWQYEYYTGQPDRVNGLPAKHGHGITLEVTKQGTNEFGEGIWRVSP